jgi:hypothetical protein
MKLLVLSFLFLPLGSLYAYEKMSGEITASIGMVNISYAEVASKLQGLSNISEPEGGGISVLAANFHYKINPTYHSSWYINGTVPFLSSVGDSYFGVGGGYEYYFSKLGNRTMIQSKGTTVKMAPKFHYFVGGEAGVGYFVYTTEAAQKSDAVFELGIMGGAAYAWKKKWSLRGQLSVAKGVGVATSTFGIKLFIGGTYFLED